ncbi:MAG: cytochrome c oxidase accessory protein CcoG [Bacteroidota bacterium]
MQYPIADIIYEDSEVYRDAIGTVNSDGKRNWLFPRKPQGRYYNWRKLASYIFLLLFFVTPFIKINGNPLFLINIEARKFVILSMPFWPQDFHLFVLAMISFFFFIILFTVIFGRLWCGWACPQTVFMEMVFRRIEYWIDGTAVQQKKLAQSPWTVEKIRKRAIKWSIFFAISFLIGNTVLAYILGYEKVLEMITSSPTDNWAQFTGILAFSTVFFFVFAWFREQACLIVCPYGRLQGVLLGKDSISIMYDWIRGEPRGKRKKQAVLNSEKGDCIDCKLCVQVCPTGIDIRNGTQMECVNCTACIDACDNVMDKIGKPRGLIRYDSHSGIENHTPFRFTTRIAAYIVLLTALLGVFGFSLASRSEVEVTLLRTPGRLFEETDDGMIRNLYNVQIVNKTLEELPLTFKVTKPEGAIVTIVGAGIAVPSQDMTKGILIVDIPRAVIQDQKTILKMEAWSGGRKVDQMKSSFLGPLKLNFK